MKANKLIHTRQLALAMLAAGLLAFPAALRSEVTDLTRTPLADATTATVLPNLMFVLDNSGSMQWSYMPDGVVEDASVTNNWHRRAGYRSYRCNKVYYNPFVRYLPPLRADGTAFPNASFNAAAYDGYRTGAPTVNLNNSFMAWRSNNSSPATPGGFDPDCWTSNNQCTVDNNVSANVKNEPEAAYYLVYRDEINVPTSPTVPPVTAVSSTDCGADSTKIKTVKNDVNNANPWLKVTVSATSGRGPAGADERQNFANWFTYYRTRTLSMKSAAGRAFSTVGDTFRIGFITINPGSPVSSDLYLPIDTFNSAQKTKWYDKLYADRPSGGTPLREALSRVGRHYAGIKSGINAGMEQDPLQYSCQQNFAILTTDGFWNSNAGITLTGGGIGNQDNVVNTAQPLYVTRAAATFDGNLLPTTSAGNSAGGADTLADVAMYYYKTDLRPAGSVNSANVDVSENNVPTSSREPAVAHQRMITFTFGLGVSGKMAYRSDYETATTGDFANIKTSSTGCAWEARNSDICNWPRPQANDPTALDDLWHAAVNGRGKYFSAQNPEEAADGLASALAGVSARVGAAAASATSSPNITETNNFIFSTTYRTVFWDGEVVAQQIDTQTGTVIAAILWSARTSLNTRVGSATDTRTIYLYDDTSGSKTKPFTFASLTSAEQAFLKDVCKAPFKLSQCADIAGAPADLTKVNDGKNLLDWLRGQTQFEGSLFRDREFVLGDSVNGIPVFVKEPLFGFGEGVPNDPTTAYGAFKAANATRQAMLYVAANDGMLHALNADTGSEVWAFVPRQLLPNLHKLADNNYSSKHEYFVDGSPAVMDVFMGGQWRTILVGGLNRGGRGFYALDITNPSTPTGLWEICSDSTLCAISDADMGFSYGNPVITKRASDGRWVVIVTSGYNNVSPGNGQGWLYVLDAATGAILNKVSTGVGDTIATCANLCGPSGFAKTSAWADDFVTDPTSKWVYGADLWGNLWRFDLQVNPPTL
ncbi:MAG TPA: PilC/PilY family type IV pilus protein, partial [Burkholderiales bacterium]|nr:PilC/PilY family type IV pilus protein [Burkholderiales bacterium]